MVVQISNLVLPLVCTFTLPGDFSCNSELASILTHAQQRRDALSTLQSVARCRETPVFETDRLSHSGEKGNSEIFRRFNHLRPRPV